MLLCRTGTCLVSSGVEGVTGEGEREAIVVREGDDVDMTGEGRWRKERREGEERREERRKR